LSASGGTCAPLANRLTNNKFCTGKKIRPSYYIAPFIDEICSGLPLLEKSGD
jgi:hypothetical protein